MPSISPNIFITLIVVLLVIIGVQYWHSSVLQSNISSLQTDNQICLNDNDNFKADAIKQNAAIDALKVASDKYQKDRDAAIEAAAARAKSYITANGRTQAVKQSVDDCSSVKAVVDSFYRGIK